MRWKRDKQERKDLLYSLNGLTPKYSTVIPFPGNRNRLQKPDPPKEQEEKKKDERNGIDFTDEEIKKMPTNAKNFFRINGKTVYYRKRTTGKYICSYEIRYSKKPYNNPPISVSATNKADLKARFVERLAIYKPRACTAAVVVPKRFHAFALYWFEHFHKRKVCARTYDHDIKLYERHISGEFGGFKLEEINAVMCQDFLDKFSDRGKTTDDLYSVLNQIFNAAVKHGLIKLNPLGMVFHKKHTTEHGKALNKSDENALLNKFEGTPYRLYFAVILYTGLRPNEYPTATIDGEFIKAVNSKRHGKEVVYKRIPISPMLRPFLNGVEALELPEAYMLEDRFKKVLPTHKLYDMRTTFQTRCTECGVNETVIGICMGNSIGKLKEAYTDLSDEFIIKELQKLNY